MSKTHQQKMAAQRQRYEEIIQGWRNDCDVAWGHAHGATKMGDLLRERLDRAEAALAALVAVYEVKRCPGNCMVTSTAPVPQWRHVQAWHLALDIVDPPKESP